MIIYVHILNSTVPYIIPFDYQPNHLDHFARLDELKQKLIATNLYSNTQLQNMFLPYTHQNPRLYDLKLLQDTIIQTIYQLIISPVPFNITLLSCDGRSVTPFIGRQNKQFWLGNLNEYDSIYAYVSC
jgi:hypothetical protein